MGVVFAGPGPGLVLPGVPGKTDNVIIVMTILSLVPW